MVEAEIVGDIDQEVEVAAVGLQPAAQPKEVVGLGG
jgi:hypothetical protein